MRMMLRCGLSVHLWPCGVVCPCVFVCLRVSAGHEREPCKTDELIETSFGV